VPVIHEGVRRWPGGWGERAAVDAAIVGAFVDDSKEGSKFKRSHRPG